MALAHRLLRGLALLALIAAALFGLYAWSRAHPEDMPWTTLDLALPVGVFTGRKLTALTEDADRCRALLDKAGVRYTALPARSEGQCGYEDAVRFIDGGARGIRFTPANLGVSCPVAAALAVWEWQVVQPAAQRHFNSQVRSIDHFGSFSCRRIYGRSEGSWSEHATADAVDIAGFRLADGRRITVAGNWADDAQERAFLREVRDGACDLFATVLSPDYNQAHHDHFHLDQARRGVTGWRGCR